MIGEKIHRQRLERGLTLSQLADRADVAKSYLSYIERGKRKNPSILFLQKIAAVLCIDVQMLLKETEPAPAYAEITVLDDEWLELMVSAIRNGMTKEQFRAVQWFIRFREAADQAGEK